MNWCTPHIALMRKPYIWMERENILVLECGIIITGNLIEAEQ